MFKTFAKMQVFLIIVLLLTGCFGGYSGETGLDVSEIMMLDDEIESRISVETGEVFGIDLPNPAAKGHTVKGASFDPTLIKVERYLEYEEDGQARLQYLFSAIADGVSDIIIKMRTAGGMEGIYRSIQVTAGDK